MNVKNLSERDTAAFFFFFENSFKIPSENSETAEVAHVVEMGEKQIIPSGRRLSAYCSSEHLICSKRLELHILRHLTS